MHVNKVVWQFNCIPFRLKRKPALDNKLGEAGQTMSVAAFYTLGLLSMTRRCLGRFEVKQNDDVTDSVSLHNRFHRYMASPNKDHAL